jgi:hypothetical protein
MRVVFQSFAMEPSGVFMPSRPASSPQERCWPVLLCVVAVLGHRGVAYSQSSDFPTLRIGASEVLVPVSVVEFLPGDGTTIAVEVPGLTAKDFKIYEDGVMRPISSIVYRPWPLWDVRANGAHYCERSKNSLSGIWDSPDLTSWPTISCHNVREDGRAPGHDYVLSFVPSPVVSGSCHRIKVKVDLAASVVAREEFCDESTPSDPLGGTPQGKQLRTFLESGVAGTIPIEGQVTSVPAPGNKNNIDISISLPWQAFVPHLDGNSITLPVGVVGLLYAKDGSLFKSFSDFGLCAPDYAGFWLGSPPAGQTAKDATYVSSSDRYERQIDLPPGEYVLKLAITNGHDFGRIQIPVTVARFDAKAVSLSSVMLCKRFHKPALSEQLYRPASYKPFMSQGIEFTPAGDTVFRKDDLLIAWFRLHVPPATGTPAARYRILVSDVQTAKVEADTGFLDAGAYLVPGSSTFDIAKEIAFSKLSPGTYGIQIQATDNTGTSTAQSSTTFTVRWE